MTAIAPNIKANILPIPRNPIQTLLDSCKNTNQLKQIHAHTLKRTPTPFHSSASSLLLASYALSPHGNIGYAKSLITHLQNPTMFCWNSILRGLSTSKAPQETIFFYHGMLQRGYHPNNFTFPSVIKACTSGFSSLHCGMAVHTHVVKACLELDPYVQSTLIRMYADGKDLDAARRVFDLCSQWDVVSWNSMIDGFVKCGELDLARSVFNVMECRDVVSWNTMINGYALLGNLSEARKLFQQMQLRNVVSWNSMLAGHVKCGDVEGAKRVFMEMPQRDVISWNSMLACYAQSGMSSEALALFDEMCHANVKPTEATIVSLLSSCAHLGALDQGEQLNAYMNAHKIEINTILGTALLDMYAKCGSIAHAIRIFRSLERKDLLAWNTMICGMALHGDANEALNLFDEMIENGIAPDDITFVAVLSACSHAGLMDKGRELFSCMSTRYGIMPKVEHYGCLIDLLSRAGLLEEAMDLIVTMPMEPNANAWGALLGGCKIHGNVDVGEEVGKRLLHIQPNHSGRYVLLSNLYAAANRWDSAGRMRSIMSTKGVAKQPGFSMIEMEGKVHQFVAGDRSHPETESIYKKLSEVMERLKVESGYLLDTNQALLDIEEEEKEHALSYHSEKLAIAFGLLFTAPGATIRVVKNLRVCRDCHHATKLISKVYGREIIMRDRHRFHRFCNGLCSCMDYW